MIYKNQGGNFFMKNQIMMLIIGILIGAIIATGVFLVLKGGTEETGGRRDMQGGEDMPTMDGNWIGGPNGGRGERVENTQIDNATSENS